MEFRRVLFRSLGRDGKMYQRRETLPSSMQVPTAWVVVDLEAVQRSIATQPQPDGVALNSGERPDREDFNPATLLDELRQKAEHLDRDGAEVVRGVSTTRYAVTMKPEQLDGGALTEHRSMTLWVGDD